MIRAISTAPVILLLAAAAFAQSIHPNILVSAAKRLDGYRNPGNPLFYPPTGKGASTLITVVPDQPTAFEPTFGKILMRVLDADTSQLLRNVIIGLCRTEAPRYCYRFRSKSSAQGVHSVLVPSIPFTMEVSAEGYESAYGEDSSNLELQVLQVASNTIKELSISLHKVTGSAQAKPKDELGEFAIPTRLPAPKIVSPADGTLVINVAHPRVFTLEWSPVEGAVTYSVDIEVCDYEPRDGGQCQKGTALLASSREPPTSGIEGTKYELTFPGTQPGRWRVWAIDAHGRPGIKTPWTMFFYKSQQ